MTGTLHEDRLKFSIMFRSVILGMRNVLRQGCRENPNTHFCSVTCFGKSWR